VRGVRKSPTPRDHETSGEYFQSGERTPARRRMPGRRAVSEPHKFYASAGPGAPAPAWRFVIEGRRCPRPEGSSQAPHNLPHVFQRRGPGQPGACSSAGGAPARAHCGEKEPAHPRPPPGEAGMGAVGLMQLADHLPSQRGAIVRPASPSRPMAGPGAGARPPSVA
jgi:hypothetical protein